MGCCENKNNLIPNKNNDLPDSFYFKGIKNEVNLRNNDNISLNSNDKKSINSFLNNKQTSKIDLDHQLIQDFYQKRLYHHKIK